MRRPTGLTLSLFRIRVIINYPFPLQKADVTELKFKRIRSIAQKTLKDEKNFVFFFSQNKTKFFLKKTGEKENEIIF